MRTKRNLMMANVKFVACKEPRLVLSDVVSPEVAEIFAENENYYDPFEQILDRKASKVTVFPLEIRGEYFIKPLFQRVNM